MEIVTMKRATKEEKKKKKWQLKQVVIKLNSFQLLLANMDGRDIHLARKRKYQLITPIR